MDATPALESIAGLLASLPDESVESMLVTFDALVGVSDAGSRSGAALLLRKTAESSQAPARRDRLLRAADAVEAGQPCALTPEGLTAQQAAAAQTITEEEWDKRVAETPLPPPPGDTVNAGDDQDDEPHYMEEEPPKLPHLPVRHFFPGQVLRVAQDFRDAHGRAVCSSDLLQVIRCKPTDDGYAISCLERNVVLNDSNTSHYPIIENAQNVWFQPVPTPECIGELLDAAEICLAESEVALEPNEDEDSDDAELRELILLTLHEEIEVCRNWLAGSGDRGPSPRSNNPNVAAHVFGGDHPLAAWMPLLFACINLDDRNPPDSAPYGMEEEQPVQTIAANASPAYQEFLASMKISYSDWREGLGYNVEALKNITEDERASAVEMLSERLDMTPGWREVEALAAIGTEGARAAIRRAMGSVDTQTRLRAAEALEGLGEMADREGAIIRALRSNDLSSGLSQAIDEATWNPSPRIQETLLDLALTGNQDQRIHCAALALYLGGKADEPFDWNHRPFFLRFGDDDRNTRVEAYKELCRRLGVSPKVQ